MDARQMVRGLVEGVLEYDGCLDGKLDFLRDCGINVDLDDLNPVKPNPTVEVRMFLKIDMGNLEEDAEDAIQSVLDDADFVSGNSCYVSEVKIVEGEPADLYRAAPHRWEVEVVDNSEVSNDQVVEHIMNLISPPAP